MRRSAITSRRNEVSAPVAIVMGSQSDWATMKCAADALDQLGVAYDARIVSAHRTPDRLTAFATGAEAEGFKVSTEVRHGDPAELLEAMAKAKGAEQIVIGRVGERGLRERIFGGVTGKLVAAATVPVTIIP